MFPVVEHGLSDVEQVGVAPTHSGVPLDPHAAQDENAGVARGLGVLPALQVLPVQTGCPVAPQAAQVPPTLTKPALQPVAHGG